MKRKLLLVFGLAACTNTKTVHSLREKVDTASLKSFITDAWHIMDASAQIDSIRILQIDTVSQKQRLVESSAYWFATLQKTNDSLESARTKITLQKSLMRTSDEYNLGLQNMKQELAQYENEQKMFESRKLWVQLHLDSVRKSIPAANERLPVGYSLRCAYRVRQSDVMKTDSATVYLDGNFKAIDKTLFFQ